MQRKQNIHLYILLLIFFLLLLPLLQAKFHIFKINPLKGAVQKKENVYFSFNEWFSGSYQQKKETYINENFGLRDFFVRLNNQVAYNLFNKAKANGVIIGKHNYLYEENYLKAYFGFDYIGYDSIAAKVDRLIRVQEYLASKGKTLLIVFAAGKGSFYPEFFPENWNYPKKVSNFDTFLSLVRENNVNHIDFNTWFVNQKESSSYPLYPKYGIHWSHYGMCLAADSMFNYIEKLRNISMPDLRWDSISLLPSEKTDYDIADGMNLLFPPEKEILAYPHISIVEEQGDQRPSAIVIADSYYWGIFNEGIPSSLFSDQHFWFYNQQIYPDSYDSPLNVSQVDLNEEIANHDIFIIMSTEANLPKLGWGFIENTYALLKNPQKVNQNEYNKRIEDMIRYIKTDQNWMNSIIEKAKKNRISIDSMLLLDARWQVDHSR